MGNENTKPSARAEEVFFAALAVPEGAERKRFLDETCFGDPDLRKWVDAELRRQLEKSLGVSSPLSPHTTVLGEDDTAASPEVEALMAALKPEEAGDTIGFYKLQEPLGEGGFGTVWLAAQDRPVRRQVALKIIRVGMNSREVIARFAQERQALALMDHPNIAKVFDAGATQHGRPFFAMELVRGLPITDYCDEHRLTIRQRLELFMQVCFALQHAHQKGIIHRDIKPTNVLVAEQDDHPAPKVIDFGIAKAIQQERLTEMTLVTQADFLLGTPLYMSPEQAESDGRDIDTRSDIYSLGALLFALIAGRTPLDPEVVAQCNFEELLHLIRDKELPRPTTVLRSMSPEEMATLAHQREIDPARIIPTVRGDLEWICMKALEKDRRRRYAAAGDMAHDIRRYLLNEPIIARPPSQFYRLKKLASRNRNAVVAGALIFFVLVLATLVSVSEALQARAAERKALASEASEADQRLRAEHESAAARLSAYVANIGLAQQAVNNGNLGRASELLEKERPPDGREGLRDFAWRYLWRLCQGDEHKDFPDRDDAVAALAYSPDGSLLAIGGLNEVTVCDAVTRQAVATLKPGSGSLGFLADGKALVTLGKGHLHLWNTADWSEKAAWPEGNGPFALSPDRTRLAVVTREGVRVRETATWKEIRFLPGARAPVAFSPDGNTLAGYTPRGLRLWKLTAEGGERLLPGSEGIFAAGGQTFLAPAQSLAFSADGATLTAPQNTSSERGVFLLRTWEVRTGRELPPMPDNPDRPEHTGAITSLALSPDGKTLATTSLDHSVRIWDLAQRLCIGALQGHRAEVGGSTFAPDGQTLVTSDRAGFTNVWALPFRRKQDVWTGIRRPLGFSADARTLAALTDDALVISDAVSRQEQRRFPLEKLPMRRGRSVAVSADLRTVAQATGDGHVLIHDAATGQTRNVALADRALTFLALTPDAGKLVFSSPRSKLRVRDLRTEKEIELPFAARRAVMSADGRLVAAVSVARGGGPRGDGPPPQSQGAGEQGGGPRAEGPGPPSQGGTNGEQRADGPLAQNQAAGEAALMGSDVSDSAAEPLVLWDIAKSAPHATLEGADVRYVLDGAFSPDGKLFATAMSDNTVRVWNTTTGALVGTCAGHRQIVYAVAFSPGGNTLASASEDGTVRLWNTQTQQELMSIPHLGEQMNSLLFAPDGSALVVGDSGAKEGGQIRLHRAPPFTETDWDLQLKKLE